MSFELVTVLIYPFFTNNTYFHFMQRFLSLFTLLCAVAIVSCKSTGELPTTETHGVDADGNVWMKAPPAGEGLQIALQPFDVPADSEVQGNFFLHLPTDIPFDVGRIEIAMNEGTHHMNMYKNNIYWPDSGDDRPVVYTHLNGKVDTVKIKYQAQFNATIVRNGGALLVEAQLPYLNWELPKLVGGKQSVIRFAANDSMIIENHYVNKNLIVGGSTSQITPNGKGKVIVNLWKDKSGLTPELSSMMFARQTHLKILPNDPDYTITKDCFFPGVTNYPISILGMTGHFHGLGKKFWADKRKQTFDASGNLLTDTLIQANIYLSSAWNEPPFTVYSTPIVLNPGEYLRYGANYVNMTSNTILFGPHVAKEEHCNLFVWFAPGINYGATVYDDR